MNTKQSDKKSVDTALVGKQQLMVKAGLKNALVAKQQLAIKAALANQQNNSTGK